MPELREGVDVRGLPLTALDGFVLSRVDGRASLGEIIAMTGLPREQVEGILVRLVELGALRWKGAADLAADSGVSRGIAPEPRPRTVPPRSPSGAPRRRGSLHPGPRRMLSESTISSPPADMRSVPPRAESRQPSAAPRGRTVPPGPILSPPSDSLPPDDTGGSAAERGSRAPASGSRAPKLVDAPYDVAELDEPVDLPRERRKQILDLYYRLPQLDYYEVLGVPYDADRKQIRAAYFSLSKAFHPDSMFRKELGSYKAKMTKVFEALTEAYETLGKQQKRSEYDAYRRSTRSIADAERALSTEIDAADAEPLVPVDVPRAPALPHVAYDVPMPTPIPAAPREVSPEARRIARELLERRLRGVGGRPPRNVAPVRVSEAPAADDRQSLAKQLTRSLIETSKLTGSSDPVTRAVLLAREAFERGDVASSVQHVARALSIAPERSDLRAEHERLSRVIAERLASDYAEHARFEAKQGKWASAAVSWAKVCEGRPEDAQAHRAAAFALMKAGGDLRGAQKYAQQAVFLAPEDVEARILLAQIHLTVGLKLNARRELETAAKLDPANEMVKNLFSELGKG